jgi:hypothetical protein
MFLTIAGRFRKGRRKSRYKGLPEERWPKPQNCHVLVNPKEVHLVNRLASNSATITIRTICGMAAAGWPTDWPNFIPRLGLRQRPFVSRSRLGSLS